MSYGIPRWTMTFGEILWGVLKSVAFRRRFLREFWKFVTKVHKFLSKVVIRGGGNARLNGDLGKI
jgi:hypothetical protein